MMTSSSNANEQCSEAFTTIWADPPGPSSQEPSPSQPHFPPPFTA